MKALVTGAAGFIGSTLASALLASGDYSEVVGVDSLTDYYSVARKRRNLSQSSLKELVFIEGDLMELDLASLLDGATHVYHLAGQPGVRASWGTEFRQYSRNNVDVTQKLLEASRAISSLESFVYSSSSSVYGNALRYPTSELDLPAPESPYGVSKLAAEHLCNVYASNFGVPTVSLRYFTVYGPRQRPDMAFTRFLTAVRDGNAVSLFGDGEQVRDFTFVSDIVQANILAASAAVAPGTVLNISGGTSISVLDVLSVIRDVTGREVRIDYQPRVSGDVRQTGGDSTSAGVLVDWAPKINIFEGLSSQWEWLLSGL